MIIRNNYIDKIKKFIDKKLIKVLIGVRRSGKTVLLSQIKQAIIKRGVPKKNIIDINFESLSNKEIVHCDNLYNYVINTAKKLTGKIYLFFDEIQEVEGWEKAINSFMVDIDCDIYITGSNSNLLSSEFATYIAGRYIQFNVYPFTLSEAKEISILNKQYTNDKDLFLEYLQLGGLPQRFSLPEKTMVNTYLNDVYNSIVIKDIIGRNKIKDIDMLKRILEYLLDNIGNTFSATSITNYFKNEKRKISVDTVLNYIQYIKNAIIINSVQRYDLKGKNLIKTNEKYFSIDLGLRNIVKNNNQTDYSKLFENIVYLEMINRGWEIRIGKLDEKEVDFVCYKDKEICYIQVAYMLTSQETIDREFTPLIKINDSHPKYVITFDELDFSREGIKHLNIIKFLLDKS